MIVEYVRYVIANARAEGFRQAYARAAQILQADPRCLSYDISQCLEDPVHFVVRIEWSSLRDHLEGFRQDPAFAEFFRLVHPFSTEIDDQHHYQLRTTSPDLPEKGLPTLYDWAGGDVAIRSLVDAFYDRVNADAVLQPLFPGGVSESHRAHVALWWGEVLGGPAEYTAIGGYPRMLARHLNLGITADQRRRFVFLLSVAADDAGLPDDPEFRAALVGYAEWGTRLAMHNSQPGAHVVRDAPVPRWGWGVAPPYVG